MIKQKVDFSRFLYKKLLFDSLMKDNNISLMRKCGEYSPKNSNKKSIIDIEAIILKKDLADFDYYEYINSLILKNMDCIDNFTESIADHIVPKMPYDLIKESNLEKTKIRAKAYMDTSGSYISKEDEDPLSAFAKNKDVPDHLEVLFSISTLRSINKDNAQKIYDIYKEFIIEEAKTSKLSIDLIENILNYNKELILENNTIFLQYYFINDQLLSPISFGQLNLSEYIVSE